MIEKKKGLNNPSFHFNLKDVQTKYRNTENKKK